MTPQQQLDEALKARHALITGQAKVSLAVGDRRIEYTPASLDKLDRYIGELRRTIAGKPAATRNRVRYMVPD